MEIAKLTSKGQITIPKAVREELGVDTGDKLIFIPCEGGFLVCNGANFNVNMSAEETLSDIGVALPAKESRHASPRPERKAVPEYDYEDEDEREEKPKKDKDKDKDKDKKKKKKKKK